ncbi:MAG: DMT family transporter [Desulfovibrionaceae bacterium]
MTVSPALRGSLAALAATVIWSGNFIIARGLADAVPPATLAFCRWSVAFLFLLPLALPALRRDMPRLLEHKRYVFLAALLGVTFFNTLIYLAGRQTEALNLSLISTFIPAFILLLSRIFLGEPLTRARLAGLCSALVGVLLLVTKGHLELLLELRLNAGDLWMLLAALLFAAYSVLMRKRPTGIDSLSLLAACFGLGLALLIPWTALELLYGPQPRFTPAALWSIIYIGLGASLAAYWLWNVALTHIGPSRAGFIYYTLPLFCGVEAVLVLGEAVTWVHLVSGVLIIGGVFLATHTPTPTMQK